MEALTLFAISLGGGLIPLFLRWTDRALHTALALATGIFLGAVFLHLLPSVAELRLDDLTAPTAEEHAGHDHGAHAHNEDRHQGHSHGNPLPWIFVLVGILAVYLIESLLLPRHDHACASEQSGHQGDLSRHRAVGYAALVGLIIHAFTAGLSLSAAGTDRAIGAAIFFAICAHKAFEGFSLATIFLLAEQPLKRIVLMLVVFSLVTPAGMLIGHGLMDVLEARGIGIAAALAAGTFLYVSLCELLPEVFHRREAIAMRSFLLIVGIALMGWFGRAGV
ncbi:MAG: ZIP family metal transporter [Planctomycetes bacterium]|nr:ZIP family metal transporter [Planctomycetota bacterium]